MNLNDTTEYFGQSKGTHSNSMLNTLILNNLPEPNYSLPTKNEYQTTTSDTGSAMRKRSYTNTQPS